MKNFRFTSIFMLLGLLILACYNVESENETPDNPDTTKTYNFKLQVKRSGDGSDQFVKYEIRLTRSDRAEWIKDTLSVTGDITEKTYKLSTNNPSSDGIVWWTLHITAIDSSGKNVAYLSDTVKIAQKNDDIPLEQEETIEATELPYYTGLPVVFIETEKWANINDKVNYVSSNIKIYDPEGTYNLPTQSAGIRGRGNTTWANDKKPYRIKFDSKQGLFGHTKAKSWVLLANYQDPTLIMNTVAFELGKRVGLPYTNSHQHVEVVLNDLHLGNYLLTEQVQVGEGRVEIDEDMGFLVEIDGEQPGKGSYWYDETDPKFLVWKNGDTIGAGEVLLGVVDPDNNPYNTEGLTQYGYLPVEIKSPEDKDLGTGYQFVIDAILELARSINSEGFPAYTEAQLRALVNVDTLIDYLLICEITSNADSLGQKSLYMYKDSKPNSKISFGPIWDFDWGFNYSKNQPPDFKYFTSFAYADGMSPFFKCFFKNPEFVRLYKARWNELYTGVLANGSMESFIEEMGSKLASSASVNFGDIKRPVWTGGCGWPNYYDVINRNDPSRYASDIADMKQWWHDRIEYLNGEISKLN